MWLKLFSKEVSKRQLTNFENSFNTTFSKTAFSWCLDPQGDCKLWVILTASFFAKVNYSKFLKAKYPSQ